MKIKKPVLLYDFCENNNRWLLFMLEPPASCPYKQERLMVCDTCPYHKMRKPTKGLLKKLKDIKESFI